MKCSKCGAELSDDARFCSFCGNKIEFSSEPPKEENKAKETRQETPFTSSEPSPQILEEVTKGAKFYANKIKARVSALWSSLSTYGKIAAVEIMVFALLLIVALLARKPSAIIVAVFQIAFAVVSILMHKGKIKLNPKQLWLRWLLLGIAALLTILNIASYAWGTSHKSNTANAPVSASSAVTPYGAAECLGQDFTTIQTEFYSSGFTNFKTEEMEDLKPADADKLNTIDSISVNGKTDFEKGQEFNPDDEVLIRYHTYTKCNVTIHIDFVPNLIFSKYDVNLLLNGIESGTLTHGEDQDFKFELDPGEYTLTFESDESSSVKGEVTLSVDCDTEASYKISCSSDKISVETLYVDQLTELADGEVRLNTATSEYKQKNYEDVATALKDLGFTNIQYEILYDIVLGWTDDGEVESVSIAGSTDCSRGDVFPANSEIIITYHMPEEDDPNKPAEDKSDESTSAGATSSDTQDTTESEPNLTVDNCPELADILSNKAENDPSYAAFATKYKGRIIEFDGRIDYCTKHENYSTRFDYLVSAGDYDPDHQIGPAFKFDNVSYSDLHTSLDTVSVGLNVHIVAEVVSYNSSSCLFSLEPVSITGR